MESRFSVTEAVLFGLVNSIPSPASIKNSLDGKYIAVNESELEAFGFNNVNDMLGLTVRDLDAFMRPCWGGNFANEVEEIDSRVKSGCQVIVAKGRVFLDRNGSVRVRDVCKSPLFNCPEIKKVVAILTLTFDYTDKVDLPYLYSKYKELYHDKDEAIHNFTKYLKIADFFYEMLTEKELLCLLSAKVNQTHKSVAAALGVTTKTIEAHLASINSKLKKTSVQDIMIFLRGNSK